jgi:hypothetical protein
MVVKSEVIIFYCGLHGTRPYNTVQPHTSTNTTTTLLLPLAPVHRCHSGSASSARRHAQATPPSSAITRTWLLRSTWNWPSATAPRCSGLRRCCRRTQLQLKQLPWLPRVCAVAVATS